MKIFVLLSRFPYPLEKGDKLRAFHQIRLLSQHHEIYLVALSEKKIAPEYIEKLQPFCKEVHVIPLDFFSKIGNILKAFVMGLPFQCGYFYSNRAKRKIDNLLKRINPDRIYAQLIRVAEYVKHSKIKKTLDYQDVFSKGMKRRAKSAPWYKKFLFNTEYRRLVRYEADIFPYFDQHTIITGVDRDLIPHPDYRTIDVIANGVDFDTYKYNGEEKIYDLIFTGNMSYVPNVEAAEYLAKVIFPVLQSEIPNLNLVICGANPSSRVKQLASEHITVTGWVDSIAGYYAKSKIFIAPMHLGTGLQNKILEAMAVGLPCVTSTLAGKPLQNAEHGKDIIICGTLTGYVEAVKLLLSSPEVYDEMSQNVYNYVKTNYSWETTTEKLEEIITRD
ncbi:glycosyltransferase [Bacteroidales bacterium OttesenSCG-928-E04]|nr:glycosyltransferase [Bacteroidales bacterium OttesenSCG-928-E04]MDL2325478.1 glycosyltransferase [Bacteroidales bacterium OttesenSCG-928-A14]